MNAIETLNEAIALLRGSADMYAMPPGEAWEERVERAIIGLKILALNSEHVREQTVQDIERLMSASSRLNAKNSTDYPKWALTLISNGYGCWFINPDGMGTAPLTVREIVRRIDTYRALPPEEQL